jgi:methylisocitrate lyase
MGYAMVIWPVSHLRIAARAMEDLYSAIKTDGGTHNMAGRMQTRAQLYETIGYHAYESLDASLVRTIVPEGMPQN